jgi:RNA polymerase-binding transcription factor DksA
VRQEIAMPQHLTDGQKALLSAELEQHERQLRAQLAAHLHGQSRVDRAHEVLHQDDDDASLRRPELAVAAALTDQEQAQLEAVVQALERMRSGHYGVCRTCGVDIPFDRLQVQPWATQCVPCAS